MAPLIPAVIGLLAETAPMLIRYFGGEKEADVAEKVINVAKRVTGVEEPKKALGALKESPEMMLAFKTAVLDQEVELREIQLAGRRMYVDDTADARRYRDNRVFVLGKVILVSFGIAMMVALVGLYKVVVGDISADPSTLAATIGLVGAIIGYFAANAQQVVSYFFGSSAGDSAKSDHLKDAINEFRKVSK